MKLIHRAMRGKRCSYRIFTREREISLSFRSCGRNNVIIVAKRRRRYERGVLHAKLRSTLLYGHVAQCSNGALAHGTRALLVRFALSEPRLKRRDADVALTVVVGASAALVVERRLRVVELVGEPSHDGGLLCRDFLPRFVRRGGARRGRGHCGRGRRELTPQSIHRGGELSACFEVLQDLNTRRAQLLLQLALVLTRHVQRSLRRVVDCSKTTVVHGTTFYTQSSVLRTYSRYWP